MPRGHRVRDIAEQAGLSQATVDRVLHGRPGASARAVRQVEQALLDLDRQQTQLRLASSTLMVDVVMQAPARFSRAVRRAVEAELLGARPATLRARFQLRETAEPARLAGVLDRLGQRGGSSQGVLLKAPDHPQIAAAVTRLMARGIPVVTLVTDVRNCPRIAYVGLDNAAAGATAAYLVSTWLPDPVVGPVLVTSSQASFFGERERWLAFAETMARLAPRRRLLLVDDADGLDERVAAVVSAALDRETAVAGVYSIGGGNRAVVDVLTRTGRQPAVYVAHDLDADNRELLAAGQLSVVLHHDLRRDVRAGFRQILRYHRLLPGAPRSQPAEVRVITPFNVPG